MFKQRFQQCMYVAGLVALMSLSLVGALALAGGLPAWAQAGPLATLSGVSNTVSYQGVLRNTDGSLVEGTYAMTFRLYDAASGGAKLHEETIPGVVVREGLFTVLLGDQAGQAIPAVAFKAPLYVSVQVGSGAEMAPRQRIAPVPYAVQLTDGLYVDDAGNVGVGKKDGIGAKLDVAGNAKVSGVVTADGFSYSGAKPFKFVTYSNLGDNIDFDTGFAFSDWHAAVVGFQAMHGDIQEAAIGDIIQVYMHEVDGTWRIRAEFITHVVNENWTVHVMYVNRRLVQ
jgi:hypothetical protein